MKKLHIGIDIDEVLADLLPEFFFYHNAKYGTNAKAEEHTTYFLGKTLNISQEEAIKRADEFAETESYDNILTTNWAKEAVDFLSKNCRLSVITGRKEEHSKKTIEWLEKHFPNKFKEIHFTNLFSDNKRVSKTEICNNLDVDILIEDSLEHAKDFVLNSPNKTAILFDKPWNQTNEILQGVIRVKNWEEVIDFIKQF